MFGGVAWLGINMGDTDKMLSSLGGLTSNIVDTGTLLGCMVRLAPAVGPNRSKWIGCLGSTTALDGGVRPVYSAGPTTGISLGCMSSASALGSELRLGVGLDIVVMRSRQAVNYVLETVVRVMHGDSLDGLARRIGRDEPAVAFSRERAVV
ncbi:uncharacterized protein IUM83_13361 [Phytophthora cinnamomi]|uniref:uncharacterized protein n=1 Tax=Phytophthora cinnamomi TaxID=4785 RepID=UPI00355ABB1C|nr:hypothetical protein IUM83_13361 [Phytophthora cinnamomi]